MTVANQTNRTSATGNGSVGQEIPFLFPITDTSDLVCYKRVTLTGVETLLDETTNYTVTISGDTGGTVTTVTAIETTEQIHIIRATPYTQSLDLEQGGSFNAENVEDALDKNTKLSLQEKDKTDRFLRFPATDPSTSVEEIPNSIDRAGKVLTFDSSTGTPTASSAVPTGSVTISTFAETFLDDANALAAMATLQGMPVINVTNAAYGATGDGSTDDTTAIQAALTAGAGNIVYFPEPASKYVISSTLTVSAGTKLMGPGAESTTIFLKAASNATMFSISQADGVTITGLEIDGNKTNQTTPKALIAISQSDHCEVSFCRLLNAGLQAIACQGGTSATTNYNHFHHNYIDTCDSFGIVLSAESADATHMVVGNTIEFNYITTTGFPGITAKHLYCRETVIHGNTIQSATAAGITASKGVQKVIISNNHIVDTIQSTPAGTLSSIHVGESGTGVTVYDIIITDNIIDPHATSDIGAISVATATRVNISDNIISACPSTTYDVIFVLGTDDDEILISDNIIESSGKIGINAYAAAVSNLTIRGNIVGACTSHGIAVASRALITGNTVHNSNTNGIYLGDADFSIVSNNISYNNEQSGTNNAGIQLNSTDNCIITGNQLFDNQGTATQSYGIRTTNFSTDNIIKNNKLSGNVLGEVSLSGNNRRGFEYDPLIYEGEVLTYENEILI